MHVLFIGLGHMGGPMATNLVRAGHHVDGFDLGAEQCAAAAEAGVTVVTAISDAAGNADVVMTSLPGPAQVTAVGTELFTAMGPDTVWIDLSTSDLDCAAGLRPPAETAAVHLVDATVSGGPEGAQAGTISVFVGGDDEPVARCMPLFEAVGGKVDHLGPHGAGYVAKIAQVSLCYTQTVCLIEALMLGVKGGVDPAKMLDLVRHSAGGSYVADTYGPEIVAGTYDPTFPLSHAAKDLRLAMEMADHVDADLPFMGAVADTYAAAEEAYGSTAPHLLAAQLTEKANELILSEYLDEEQT